MRVGVGSLAGFVILSRLIHLKQYSNMLRRRKFLTQVSGGSLGLAVALYLPGCQPGTPAETEAMGVTPESLGVSSTGLLDFFEAVEKSGLEFHSIMINRHGQTLLEAWWEPFEKEYIHALYSLSKSFTATAIGMLHDDGKLSVEDNVISFFPDKLPATVSDHLAAMRIYDLLTMHTGHDEDTMGRIRAADGNDWVKNFLHLEVPKAPGSHFLYNTGASYMLSAIAQQVCGQNLMSFLQPRLLEPLGIVGADWEEDPQGINVGGYGLRVRTSDILNFGQLYLQKGRWKGQQLLSEAWVEEATKKQVDSQDNDSDWGQGYGYQFWRCTPGFYRGDGAFGQYCIVMPDQDAVVAITSESKDMGASMQLVWDHILPAMHAEPIEATNKDAGKSLNEWAKQLSLPVVELAVETQRSLIDQQTYTFEDNGFKAETVSFRFKDQECEAVFVENGKTIKVVSGLHHWVTGDHRKEGNTLFAIPGRTPQPTKLSSHYYWSAPMTLVIVIKYVENAHGDQFTFTFADQELELVFGNSVAHKREQQDGRPAIKAKVVA